MQHPSLTPMIPNWRSQLVLFIVTTYSLTNIRMPGIMIQKPVTVTCKRCDYVWEYNGNNPYVATCSHCKTTISLKKFRIETTPQSGQDANLVQTAGEPITVPSSKTKERKKG